MASLEKHTHGPKDVEVDLPSSAPKELLEVLVPFLKSISGMAIGAHTSHKSWIDSVCVRIKTPEGMRNSKDMTAQFQIEHKAWLEWVQSAAAAGIARMDWAPVTGEDIDQILKDYDDVFKS
jgi:hypothetical protein